MSAPHCIHLVAADSGLLQGQRYSYIALCEVLLTASSLPPALCSEDCDCEVGYCSDCLRAAAQVNAEAGLANIAPGVRVMTSPGPYLGGVQ